ncbi:hypothetical protein Q4595_27915, partial [Wenyingzhuangia sp. 1_MG-2023]|nr:hypothetical protein [Wenyingzhuangia sp. 1_MG-2023]
MLTEAYGALSSIPEFGQLALIMAFVVAVFQTVVPLWGVHRNNTLMMAYARPLAAAQALFLLVSL